MKITAFLPVLLIACFSSAFANENMEAMAKTKNCLTCHTVEKKILGPAYKDVAIKYAEQPDMAATLADKIKNGSAGVWGPLPMPANPLVSEDDAKLLAEWVLSHK